ncbi:YfiR family protein [Undibacterium sp. Ji50W]|uniref:YfiR family protein n=1 Tax=Undibacterium sp. Ji50W TaxID=3413041 RepID=UPI003BF24336
MEALKPENLFPVPELNGKLFSCLLLSLLLILLPALHAQGSEQNENLEQRVKAAYLFKFCSYVEWPEKSFPTSDSVLNIAVLGSDGVANELLHMAQERNINGRSFLVKRLKGDEGANGLNGVHVLFVARSSNKMTDIVTAAKGRAILIVTETEGALSIGSMINFVIVDGKVRFEVAPKTATQDLVLISSRLISVAYKVAGGQ